MNGAVNVEKYCEIAVFGNALSLSQAHLQFKRQECALQDSVNQLKIERVLLFQVILSFWCLAVVIRNTRGKFIFHSVSPRLDAHRAFHFGVQKLLAPVRARFFQIEFDWRTAGLGLDSSRRIASQSFDGTKDARDAVGQCSLFLCAWSPFSADVFQRCFSMTV